jgi:hypothetical protein
MTNFEALQAMSKEQLAEWIDKYIFERSAQMLWFDQHYCSKCEPIICKYEDGGREFPCSYCEIYNRCKFFPEKATAPDSLEIIKLWFDAEVEE